MKIYVEKTNEKLDKEYSGKAGDLLKELKLSKENVLVVRNGDLITEEDELSETDSVKILSVISGG